MGAAASRHTRACRCNSTRQAACILHHPALLPLWEAGASAAVPSYTHPTPSCAQSHTTSAGCRYCQAKLSLPIHQCFPSGLPSPPAYPACDQSVSMLLGLNSSPFSPHSGDSCALLGAVGRTGGGLPLGGGGLGLIRGGGGGLGLGGLGLGGGGLGLIRGGGGGLERGGGGGLTVGGGGEEAGGLEPVPGGDDGVGSKGSNGSCWGCCVFDRAGGDCRAPELQCQGRQRAASA